MSIDIKWEELSNEDREIISKIQNRAVEMIPQLDPLTINMDISAVHLQVGGLRLKDLLEADDFNFRHDVTGIYNCLDRESGEFNHQFRPRFHA